jgi:hypothetical protein
MGTPDCYGSDNIQLKIGRCECRHYDVGDRVEIPDGVYVGHEGVVVIKDSVMIATFPSLTDKWGGSIDPESVLMDRGVIAAKVKKLVNAHKKPRRQ